MSNKKILVVGSYPIKNSQHGGQKRILAITESYKKVFKEVRYTGIFYKEYETDYTRQDVAVGEKTAQKISKISDFSDIYCGEAIYDDPIVKEKITKLLLEFQPDLIHIEQPYIYLGLKPLLQEIGIQPKLVFGSQNIEFKMKKSIYESLDIDEKVRSQTILQIERLETELSKISDLVVAVSAEDAAEHTRMGASKVIVAANGISKQPFHDEPSTPGLVASYEGQYMVSKKILFIGSAHPPNWLGFEKMVTRKLGFLPSDARIYLIGGVSDYFAKVIKNRTTEDVTFWQRAVHCGRISEKRLTELLATAELILLPITEGGGSNLKTAEAFVANKKIVATSYAMRSYEYLSGLPNLFIADTPQDFRQSILRAIKATYVERSAEEQKIVDRVLWDHCLQDLMQEVVTL